LKTLSRITDPSDKRIEAYREIRERDLVGRQNRFVAEGKVVLNVLANQSRFKCESVLVLENKLAGIEPLLASLPEDVQFYVAAKDVIDQITGFPVHRGILAIGRRDTMEAPASMLAKLPKSAVVLVLGGISNHDNIGGIFRNAAAFGAAGVLLDPQCCDPLYRKAIRVSVGGVLKVPFARMDSVNDAIGLLSDNGFDIWSLTPAGTHSIDSSLFAPRTAFILGSEGDGLATEVLQATNTLRIPIMENFDSLNVATSSAIALHRYFAGTGALHSV
jgi:tRNA G18 (ribose-2'-O)-methylase SpoU